MWSKEQKIRQTQHEIGWAYPDLKWFTDEEATLANKKRDELLNSLSKQVNLSFMKTKVHIGDLSPGCLICGKGYWSCIFINHLCTANCFYCPQDRKIKEEKSPYGEIQFNTPEEYLFYLEKFNIKGVGFSGGETLLVFDRLLTYITIIREKFGDQFYIWIYTNGDLIDEEKIRKLKESGLNELRFNISARDYDLHCVELAINNIDTVTVEIPSIPEDHEKLKKILIKMRKIGVNYLNIHQLLTSKYNYKNYISRGYTLVHQPNNPVFESEMAALKLIKYALENKIDLPINYCTSIYKNRFQSKARRARMARIVKEDFEESTRIKFIRRLSIRDSSARINRIVKILKENNCPDSLWSLNDVKTEIFIHGTLLKNIDFTKYGLTVSYFEPRLKKDFDTEEASKEFRLNPHQKKFFIKRVLLFQKEISNTFTKECFKKLFIKDEDENEVFHYFFNNYPLKTKESLNELKKETEILKVFKIWEHLPVGFSEIF